MDWRRAISAVGFIVLLVAVAALVLHAVPAIVGADHSFVVQSGSMEPTIMTGSTLFVTETPVEQVEAGDVITYRDDSDVLVTHRVIEVHRGQESIRFTTKGDANEDPDPEPVYRDQYLGTVTKHGPLLLTLPFTGYLVSFAQTRLGWVVLVLIPVALLVGTELWALYRDAKRNAEADNE